MDRRIAIAAAGLAALVAGGGCQDYNFNPVGHCLIQPGTKSVTVSKVATADVLFVVDDSGSMGGEQSALGTEFPRFLDVLARVNRERVLATPAQPAFDFHIAVTSTSSYYNEPPVHGAICSNTCPGAIGQNVCCLQSATGVLTSPQPPLCQTSADCAGGSYSCSSTCTGLSEVNSYGENGCCDTSGNAQPIACDRLGEPCGIFDRFYYHDGICTPGYGQTGAYPAGHFMADPTNASPNDGKVLHFDKDLAWDTWAWTSGGGYGGTDSGLVAVANAFKKNVTLGTCGSPQEQGFEVARRAIKGTLGVDGLSQPGLAAGEWLHDGAKLVVVFISDEDDCSAPYSAGDGVVFPLSIDGCVADAALPVSQQRQFQVASYADYFLSLGRPFAAAFIVSANNGCQDASCVPLICSPTSCSDPTPGTCGGQGVPTRYLSFAQALRDRNAGVDVIEGSICDAFGDSLGRIARIVKPPDGLELPTIPAAGNVTVLRIADAAGKTLRTCSRPAPPPAVPIPDPADVSNPADPSNVAAQAYLDTIVGSYDWWFTDSGTQVMPWQKLPTAPSQHVFINHATARCEATSGETYSVDYIGQLPEGGCTLDDDCVAALGGRIDDWTCFAGMDTNGLCTAPAGNNGTCICGGRSKTCPNG